MWAGGSWAGPWSVGCSFLYVLAFVRVKCIRVKYRIFSAVYGISRIQAGWTLPRFRRAPEQPRPGIRPVSGFFENAKTAGSNVEHGTGRGEI
jgi:hypothetical protein